MWNLVLVCSIRIVLAKILLINIVIYVKNKLEYWSKPHIFSTFSYSDCFMCISFGLTSSLFSQHRCILSLNSSTVFNYCSLCSSYNYFTLVSVRGNFLCAFFCSNCITPQMSRLLACILPHLEVALGKSSCQKQKSFGRSRCLYSYMHLMHTPHTPPRLHTHTQLAPSVALTPLCPSRGLGVSTCSLSLRAINLQKHTGTLILKQSTPLTTLKHTEKSFPCLCLFISLHLRVQGLLMDSVARIHPYPLPHPHPLNSLVNT